MNKTELSGLTLVIGVATIIACDSGSGQRTQGLGANDCPIGTFRPVGLSECVFPASDLTGVTFNVSDNRCAGGAPAVPPACVSDSGQRAYLATSPSQCVTGYRFLDGACDRNDGCGGCRAATGAAGTFGNFGGFGGFGGFAGFGGFGDAGFGVAGSTAASSGFGFAGNCTFGTDPETGQCLPSPPGIGGIGAAGTGDVAGMDGTVDAGADDAVQLDDAAEGGAGSGL
jgi:hypothetical protein